jgi:hypothetical protein
MEPPERLVAAAIAAARNAPVTRLGLRFDRVVERVRRDLLAHATPVVPASATLLVTLTAPILQPAKTVESIAPKLHALAARSGTSRRDLSADVHGNHVRLRLWSPESPSAARLWLFVHNRDVDAKQLLDDACAHGLSAGRRAGGRSLGR